MREAETYKNFARECLRMAQNATAKDKAVLMQIAEAWEERAREAQRQHGKAKPAGPDGGSGA